MPLPQLCGSLKNQQLPVMVETKNPSATGGGKTGLSTFKPHSDRKLSFDLSVDYLKDPTGKAIFI